MRQAILEQADSLLWIIARSDVEGISAHRSVALEQLHALEIQARMLNIPDLYGAVSTWEESRLSAGA